MRAESRVVYPPGDEPSWTVRGEVVVLSFGRIEVHYLAPGALPRISVAGQPLALADAPPAESTEAFALAAGAEGLLVSDREARQAMLVPRDAASAREARTPFYVCLLYTSDAADE